MKCKIIKSFLALFSICPSWVIAVSCSLKKQEIAILFTNDIHATIHNEKTNLGFSKLAGYRDNLEKQGIKTLLVDSGDFVQGTAYGTISKGKIITQLLNTCKYDVVAPGNHEFDFGMDRFNEIKNNDLNCPIISSNFYKWDFEHKKETERVIGDTAFFEIGNKKIGFVGMTTPDALTTSNPKSFQDESNNYIYTFLGYEDPITFYTAIQNSIDFLKNDKKCDYVFGLGHLGASSKSNYDTYYSSNAVVKNTSGFDAIFDGHSHAFMQPETFKDKNNKDVYITQTGTQFNSFGDLRIKKDGQLSINLVKETNFVNQDVQNKMNEEEKKVKELFSEKLGTIDFDLRIDDGKTPATRLVRKEECNCGDFYVDAIAHACKNDGEGKPPITIINAGCIRTNILKGDVTVGHMMELAPFCNNIARIKVTGKQLKDALEFSVHKAEKSEFGGFLQVSSRIKYSADLTYESPCILDGDRFSSVDPNKKRRVTSVKIDDVEIDDNKTYDLGGTAYFLRDGGDGYTMFKGCEPSKCPEGIDSDALKNYFCVCFENKQLDKYRTVGDRITLIK